MPRERKLDSGTQRRIEERKKKQRKHRGNTAHGSIYFVQNLSTQLIKIGYTLDVNRRMSELNACNAGKIVLLAHFYCRGPKRYEKLVHLLFDELRVENEWFRPNGMIWDFLRHKAVEDITVDKWAYHYIKSMSPRDRQRAVETYGSKNEAIQEVKDMLSPIIPQG